MLVLEGKAYHDGKLQALCIGVEDGKISAVKRVLRGDPHLDFGSMLILPAGIDIHVHFREPGFTHKEDFATGTAVAAFGGIGCVIDMPNTRPPTVSVPDIRAKTGIARKKAYVDFGLNAALTPGSDVSEISKSATGFKLYLMASTAAEDIAVSDFTVAGKLLEKAAGGKVPVSIHCEDEKLFGKGTPRNTEQFLAKRPGRSESEPVRRIISAIPPGLSAHICHVSSAETVEILRTAKKKGTISCEVAPHHLLLNAKSGLGGGLGKVNPPLRAGADQAALWDALNDGTIDILASDHAPHTLAEKKEFEDAPSGMPGVETMYPMMLPFAKKGKLPIGRLVNAISENPARLYGMNKGKLAPGMDADLIVVDMKKITEIRSDAMHSKCGWTPFEGREAVFPVLTMVRGEIIVSDSELVGKRGFGSYVT
jgi:dihydroorotase